MAKDEVGAKVDWLTELTMTLTLTLAGVEADALMVAGVDFETVEVPMGAGEVVEEITIAVGEILVAVIGEPTVKAVVEEVAAEVEEDLLAAEL